MSSISEESETGDDEQLDDEYLVRNERHTPSASFTVENCLGDLNSFKAVRRFSFFFIDLTDVLLIDHQISFSFEHKLV